MSYLWLNGTFWESLPHHPTDSTPLFCPLISLMTTWHIIYLLICCRSSYSPLRSLLFYSLMYFFIMPRRVFLCFHLVYAQYIPVEWIYKWNLPKMNTDFVHTRFSREKMQNLALILYGLGLWPTKTKNQPQLYMYNAISSAMSIDENSATDKTLVLLESYEIDRHKLRKQRRGMFIFSGLVVVAVAVNAENFTWRRI